MTKDNDGALNIIRASFRFRYGLMQWCWATNPNDRPNFDEIQKEFEVTGYGYGIVRMQRHSKDATFLLKL
jgi:hypothetical protein